MHARFAFAVPLLALLAASEPVRPAPEPIALTAQRAIAEAKLAEARVVKLQKAADEAKSEAERIGAQRAAAAEAIAAAEARISAADANARAISAQIQLRRERLQREAAPVTSLLGGLAVMAERPPLLAVLDQGSTQEFVKVRLLLDATLPVIQARTASLRAELDRGRKLQLEAEQARSDLVNSRNALAMRKQEFAELEGKAVRIAQERGGEALGAGDVALARGEEAADLVGEARRGQQAQQIASEMSRLPAPPARPGTTRSPAEGFAYILPSTAPVVEGLSAIAPNGVRSRGLTLATGSGAEVIAPAAGTIRFSGPFRSYDAVIIIDHGNGWMSLLLNVASPLKSGQKVQIGQPLGRAIGRISVELSRNGRHVSPALIAGSSQNLSKGLKQS
ncbi:murein hydrolase activator EnvC family protein [Sphingomonas daechungensis]|uniref:murein hydrolase activator EnvC family protein n=1 Tax=Sphingomonas daechungensis TaxID=1176646 RepID=UPI003784032E